MSDKAFKVGDRVRVANELLDTNGMLGSVSGVGDDSCMVTIDAYGTRAYKKTSILHDKDQSAQQLRLPQVGEVWRSRDGEFTVKLELSTVSTTLKDGYVFAGRCSDGPHRTFTAEGTYSNDGSYDHSDLVELVSEAQPEPAIQAPQESERFAYGQYWTNAGMDFIAGPDWSFIYETTANGNVKRHTARCSDGIRRWWCGDGKCVSGGDTSIQNDLVRQVDADAKPVERKSFPLSSATDLAVLMDALAGRKGEHQKAIAEVYVELCTSTLKKNSDYGSSVFKRPMFAKECDPWAAIRVRMSDKFERMLSLSEKPPEVTGESLEDSIDDFVNYRILQKVAQRLIAKT